MIGNRFGSVAQALGVALALAAWPAVGMHHDTISAQGARIVVNEVQYDPSPTGSENAFEWLELLNTGSEPVQLDGWQITDNRASDRLPAAELPPGEFLVVAGGTGFAELFPGFVGRLVTLEGSIGNGLGNSGDQVRLLDADGVEVDGMSYGGDADAIDPPAPDVEPGHSLERVPAGVDTDTADDWRDQPAPSPGRAADMARPSPSPTAAPIPVPPGATVVLNEYLPAPREIDWDGDGQAGPDDEWVELFNPGGAAIDLRGWQLDDVADGGSAPHLFPDGTVIAARGHLVLFKRDSGVALNNSSDSVRLLMPDGVVADETTYARSAPDVAYARLGDGAGAWTDTLAPSPGEPNLPGGATPDPGPPPSATPGEGPTVSPPTAAATATARPGVTGSPPPPVTATVVPGLEPARLPFVINEVMFDPEIPGADAAAEWVELYNVTDEPVSLGGWTIGDRVAWDPLPPAVVAPRGFVVVRAADGPAAVDVPAGAPVVTVADGAIGNGLSNTGDVVRLRGPTGAEADAVSYGANLDAFDPAVPIGPPGASIERLPPGADTDTADDWWLQPAPSPGRAGARHEGPPRVVINEALPAPLRVDWNGDGAASLDDEWVELFNAAGYGVDLAGWRLENRAEDGWWYALPANTLLAPGGFLVVHHATSGVSLRNEADTVRLIRPDGVTADRLAWDRSPGHDRSWSRTVDGAGDWVADYAVTPGGPNRPRQATERRPPTSDDDSPAREVAWPDVRALPRGTRVVVRGRITAPPGVFGARTAYLGDESGGVMLYLAPRDAELPALAEGTGAAAIGRLTDYRGEREVVLNRPGDLWVEGPSGPVVPAEIATGELGEATEGRLVRLAGRVTGWRGAALFIDDGTGEVRVSVRQASGFRRPYVQRGQWLTVVGLAGQSAAAAPWSDGYRLVPRWPADFGASSAGSVPAGLPRAGFGSPSP